MGFRLFDHAHAASAPAETSVVIQPAAPAPVLGLTELAGAVTFTETLAQTGVVLDSAVSFVQGAGSLNGAVLTASFSANGRSTDQLGIMSDGSGVGQVDYSGNSVSYGGTTVGTVAGGDNGAALTVTFNASASAAAVEAVIEHLAYQTTSGGPLPSRTVVSPVCGARCTSVTR